MARDIVAIVSDLQKARKRLQKEANERPNIEEEIKKLEDELKDTTNAANSSSPEAKGKKASETEIPPQDESQKPGQNPKISSEETKKPASKYSGQIQGVKGIIGSLEAKMAELRAKQKAGSRNPQNENEEIRGFDSGGSSVEIDLEAQDIEAQIAMIEAEIGSQQKKLFNLQELENIEKERQFLRDFFAQAKENGILQEHENDGKGGYRFSCASEAEAEVVASQLAGKYKQLGFDCDISKSKGNFTVVVKMPESFKDRDPLNMSPEEIIQAREALQAEKTGKNQEQSQQKSGTEKSGEPSISQESWVSKIAPGRSGLEIHNQGSGKWADYVRGREAQSAERGGIEGGGASIG
jgi:hypothetical protein